MEEKVYYDDGSNKVTSARFVANGTTHAMNGITSVKQRRADFEAESKKNAIITIVVGVMIAGSGSNSLLVALFGIAVIAVGVFLLKGLAGPYSVYHIVTASASGETEALSSRDGTIITEIENALNNAIIGRG